MSELSKKAAGRRVVSGAFLIAGTMIGAGMLGIPLVTAPSGFLPAISVTLLVWFFMYCTGLLFLEVSLWMPDGSNLLSMADRFFGKGGRLFSGVLFIFLYYCLMVGYFAVGAPLLAQALRLPIHGWHTFALFGTVFGSIVAISPRLIDRFNIIISVAMIATYLILVGGGASGARIAHLKQSQWSTTLLAMPVLFSAFGFHNVIPSLCTYLKRDKKSLKRAIFWGSFLPCLIYSAWQWLIIGSLPREFLIEAAQKSAPLIAPFSHLATIGELFALFAIVTSTLGVAFSMVDFFGDGLKIRERKGCKRLSLTLLTFLPPCILAAFNPGIFKTALGVAGGIGEAFLNGLLPIALLWIGKYSQKLKGNSSYLESKGGLLLLASYALLVIGIEIYELIGFV